jgi:hypothetical protein
VAACASLTPASRPSMSAGMMGRWTPGEAALESSLRVQRYSYVFESAGETCRVEPA